MRRPKRDKRSELAVKYCCHGSVHRAKPEFKVWQRYPAQTPGRLAAKDFVPSVSNASALSTALSSVISASKVQL
jgi:hypothetical protein